MKKIIALTLATGLFCGLLTGCNSGSVGSNTESGANNASITVITRESGSGTRGAFIELFGVEEKDANGEKIDKTIASADVSNSTGVVLTNVSSDKNAIGYISLGSLNNTVKALKIDGAAPTVENVKSGAYTISRPFNIATKGTLTAVAQDFVDFILSAEGQAVVQENDFIPLDGTAAYTGTKPSGKIVIAGSSSVTPLMEKLKEAYGKINTEAKIEIQQSDSSSGMKSTIEGICDIGMASRELKESEISQGLTATVIATDGIAVIVNPENSIDGLTKEQVKTIYTGNATKWSDISQ